MDVNCVGLPVDLKRLGEHFLRLSSEDRYLRFGSSAGKALIGEYIERIRHARQDVVLGIVDDKGSIIAACHVALFEQDDERLAELGISVDAGYRGRGLARHLMTLGIERARRAGAHRVCLQCASHNRPILHLAVGLGMRISRSGGSEVTASLTIEPCAVPNFMDRYSNIHKHRSYEETAAARTVLATSCRTSTGQGAG